MLLRLKRHYHKNFFVNKILRLNTWYLCHKDVIALSIETQDMENNHKWDSKQSLFISKLKPFELSQLFIPQINNNKTKHKHKKKKKKKKKTNSIFITNCIITIISSSSIGLGHVLRNKSSHKFFALILKLWILHF